MGVPNHKFECDKIIPPEKRNTKDHDEMQNKQNALREAYIKTLDKKTKKNFLLIEKYIRKLEAADIPFLIFADPAGYDPQKSKGFWRYQRLQPLGTEPYSETGFPIFKNLNGKLLVAMARYYNLTCPDFSACVKDRKTGEIVHEYEPNELLKK